MLKATLNALDGVYFTGGMLAIRVYHKAPESVKNYYDTAKYVYKYALEHKLPLLGVCQGFQLFQMIVCDIFYTGQEDI